MNNNEDVPNFDDTEPVFEDTESLDETGPSLEAMPSKGQAVLEGAKQGATMGFADEMGGGLQSLLLKLSGATGEDAELAEQGFTGDLSPDMASSYTQARDENRAETEAIKELHPKSFMAGEIGGGLATAVIPGMQAATLGKATALGGAAGLGYGTGDLTAMEPGQFGQAALETGLGAGLGAGGFKIADKLSKYFSPSIQSASQGLRTEAEDTAMSATGARIKDFEKEFGSKSIFTPVDQRKGIGAEALKELQFTGGKEGVLKRTQEGLSNLIKYKDSLLQGAEESLQYKLANSDTRVIESLTDSSVFSRGQQLKDKLVGELKLSELDPGISTRTSDLIDNYLGSISELDNSVIGLEKLKKTIGKSLTDKAFEKREGELGVQDKAMRGIYDILKNRIEGLTDFSLGKEAGTALKEINMKESNLIDLATMLGKARAKSATGGPSWGDIFAGSIGAGIGTATFGPGAGSVAGFGAGMATKSLGERLSGYTTGEMGRIATAKGLQKAANTGDSLAKNLPNMIQSGLRPAGQEAKGEVEEMIESKAEPGTPQYLSENLYKATKDELGMAAQKLSQNPKYAQYGDALMKSTQEGSSLNKNAVLFNILQNPHMRKLLYEQ